MHRHPWNTVCTSSDQHRWFRSEKRPGQAVLEFTVRQNHFEDSAVLPLLASR